MKLTKKRKIFSDARMDISDSSKLDKFHSNSILLSQIFFTHLFADVGLYTAVLRNQPRPQGCHVRQFDSALVSRSICKRFHGLFHFPRAISLRKMHTGGEEWNELTVVDFGAISTNAWLLLLFVVRALYYAILEPAFCEQALASCVLVLTYDSRGAVSARNMSHGNVIRECVQRIR